MVCNYCTCLPWKGRLVDEQNCSCGDMQPGPRLPCGMHVLTGLPGVQL